MIINSGVSEVEVLNSFEDLNLQTNKESLDAPKDIEKIEDLLGQPSEKFDYKVLYSKPSSYDIPIKPIIPDGVMSLRMKKRRDLRTQNSHKMR